jgi:hypothetical protein
MLTDTDELRPIREEIAFFLEWEGPLTRDEIQKKLEPTRLTLDNLIGCLSYLTVEGQIERQGRRFAPTAETAGADA